MFQRILVDDIHKVLLCLHAKVGCSTWKMIMANNTSFYPIPSNAKIGIHAALLNYNISFLHDEKYSEEDIHYRLKHYFKAMIVRHPYDRYKHFSFRLALYTQFIVLTPDKNLSHLLFCGAFWLKKRVVMRPMFSCSGMAQVWSHKPEKCSDLI